MPITSSGAGETGARFKITGVISTGASWVETYSFQIDGSVIDADADIWTWQFNFRKTYDDAADLSLTTTDSEITVTNGADSTSIAINAAYSALEAMEGDYIADLVYQTAAGVRVHWAHGTVTFRNEPIWSS
jgi:hypothetical protein